MRRRGSSGFSAENRCLGSLFIQVLLRIFFHFYFICLFGGLVWFGLVGVGRRGFIAIH